LTSHHQLVSAALRALGIERLVLAIHDVSFPSAPGEDVGRGSPYARGGRAFIDFVRGLGFDGIQLGPQGQTSLGNPSPYDGSVFSKSILSIALADLAEPVFAGVLPRTFVDAAAYGAPSGRDGDSRAYYTQAFRAQTEGIALAASNLARRVTAGDPAAKALAADVATFAGAKAAAWLPHDARFEAFATVHGTDDWRTWPEGDRMPSSERSADVERAQRHVIDAYVLGQYLLDAQHRALREHLKSAGVRLYGDLQVGLSLRDRWSRGGMFLDRYRMGAPPSRTNPEGQPWGYPVLDPRQYQARFAGVASSSAPLAFVSARVTKLFAELDGVRIDHPHGLVCPWVYDGDAPDPMLAVVNGARLFETPASAAHPTLASLAIARPDQIDAAVPAYDDEHVHDLTAAQVTEYERIFAIVMDAARAAGRDANDVLCEVLSTCPAPLACVMQRYGLGRFRVTQKASLVDPTDGYRGENAHARDWIMIGNHDTPPLRAVIDRWTRHATIAERAAYLATRLEPNTSRRKRLATSLASDPRRLALGMFAELFVGPAANVLVFFADLYGETATYNTPGLVSADNWSMRVPGDYAGVYEERRVRGEAMDLPGALALAMRARGEPFVQAHAALIAALEARAAVRL
jgi:4-alpha-glucanotransferase